MSLVRVGVVEQLRILNEERGDSEAINKAVAVVQQEPVAAQRGFNDMLGMTRKFVKLPNRDMAIVRSAETILMEGHENSAVVAKVRMLNKDDVIVSAIDSMKTANQPMYRAGRGDLAKIIEESDTDLAADQIGAILAERALTAALKSRGLSTLVESKSWAIPIASAMIGLDVAREKEGKERVYLSWRFGEVDDLVQITPRRAKAYVDASREVQVQFA